MSNPAPWNVWARYGFRSDFKWCLRNATHRSQMWVHTFFGWYRV